MSDLTIRLPDGLREFVEAKASGHGFDSASEYVRSLIDDARRRDAAELLEAELLKGLRSGPGIVVDEAFWREREERLIRRLEQERRS